VIETVRNIAAPTGQIFSGAVPSPGDDTGYEVPTGIVFGYPLRGIAPGQVEIVQGIQHDAWAAERINTTLNELIEERDAVGALAA
jgi:malate/lactate dehydrogenase